MGYVGSQGMVGEWVRVWLGWGLWEEQWGYSTASKVQVMVQRMHMGRFVQVQVWVQGGKVVKGFGEVEDVVELEVGGCGWVLEVGEWLNDHASGLWVVEHLLE